MHYLLHLPERPFRSIKKGTKKAEGRVFRNTTPYHEMKSGDTITFVNEDTEEKMDVDVFFVHHYPLHIYIYMHTQRMIVSCLNTMCKKLFREKKVQRTVGKFMDEISLM